MSFTSTSMAGGADFEYPQNLSETNGCDFDEFYGKKMTPDTFCSLLDSIINETVTMDTTKMNILKITPKNLDVHFTPFGISRKKEHEKMD